MTLPSSLLQRRSHVVMLRNPATRAIQSDVSMLLDSGADVTLVPQAAVHLLGIPVIPDKRCELVGCDGNVSFVPVVRLELLFLRRTFRGQFLLIEQEWSILGRNVLNAVSLLFEGPHLT